MKHKVLFLSTSAQDYSGAGGRTRVVSESKFVFGDNFQITLFCLVPLRKFLKIKSLYKAKQQLAKDGDFRVIYFPKFSSFNVKMLIKTSHNVNAVVVRIAVKMLGAKLVHSHGVTASYLAIKATGKTNVKVMSDMHGIESEEHAQKLNVVLDSDLIRPIQEMEKVVFDKADHMFVVSQKMIEYLKFNGLRSDNMTLVPCATRLPKLLTEGQRKALRKELGFEGKDVFLYLGSHRPYQMATETVQLFKEISDKINNAHFFILTSHIEAFRKELKNKEIDKTNYTMFSADQSEVFKFVQLADFGFMLRRDSPVNTVASPTKFAEYLLCGLPVITTPYVGDYSKIVKDHELGYMLKKYTYETELQDYIQSVIKNRKIYSDSAHNYGAENLIWSSLKEKMTKTYQKLLRD